MPNSRDAMYRALVADSPVPIYLHHADRVTLVNAACVRLFGATSPEQLIGKSPLDLFVPDARARIRDRLRSLREGGIPTAVDDEKAVRLDGSIIDVEVAATAFDDDGTPAIHVVLRDVTERRAAEAASARRAEELRRSEERYRHLIDSLDDVVFSVDAEGRLAYVSGAVSRYGFSTEEVLGHRFQDFVHPDDRRRIEEEFAARLAADMEPYEFRILDAKGSVRIVRSSGRRVFEEGRVVGLAGILLDLTAQRRTEEQLRLSQKIEAIGRLAGGVAHDFNNLLTVISSYAGIALRGLRSDDPLRADLEEIRKAGDRATALTRQLLAFSRKQVLQPEVLDLNVLVSGIERMLKRLIGEDIDLRFRPHEALWRIKADPGQLEQVVMNLVVNARDAMPDGGDVTIETGNVELDDAFAARNVGARAGAFVMLSVTDTGGGMDAGTRDRLFEPFFTTKVAGKGTGLGLATVYGIVKQSGGSIWVHSESGHGATFKVYLPRVHEELGGRPRLGLPAPAHGGTETILFVEDDEAVRGLAGRILTAAGYSVLLAATGGEALILEERHRAAIDLVATDVVMPGMSGRELAARLSPVTRRKPVLFMSGYSDDAIAQHGVLEPGAAFLAKPFTPESLVAMIRDLLDRAR